MEFMTGKCFYVESRKDRNMFNSKIYALFAVKNILNMENLNYF